MYYRGVGAKGARGASALFFIRGTLHPYYFKRKNYFKKSSLRTCNVNFLMPRYHVKCEIFNNIDVAKKGAIHKVP